jgi:hypothetical protein
MGIYGILFFGSIIVENKNKTYEKGNVYTGRIIFINP